MLTCNKKGVTVYFVVIVLFLLLGVSMGLGMIISTQIRNIITAGDSVIAIAAADAGMEDALFSFYKGYDSANYNSNCSCQSQSLPNNVSLCCPKEVPAENYKLSANTGYTFKFAFNANATTAEIYSVGYYPFSSQTRAKRVLYARW